MTTDPRFDGVLRLDTAPHTALESFLPVLHPLDSHAATMVETPDNTILCAWFNGPQEGAAETNVVTSRFDPAQGRWESPTLVAHDPERSEQNPVLFVDPQDVTWLLHTSNLPHNRADAHVVARCSDDGGRTWSEPWTLFQGPGFFLKHAPVFLNDDTWLLPAYHVTRDDGAEGGLTGEYSSVSISRDRGQTWEAVPIPGTDGLVQPTLTLLPDDTLLVMMRSRRADRIHVSRSHDRGLTWSEAEATQLPSNNSAIAVAALPDGRLVLAFNDASLDNGQFRWVGEGDQRRRKALRTPLSIAISDDAGRTWGEHRTIVEADEIEYPEREVGYSYPWLLVDRHHRVHLAYSYLRKAIRHHVLDAEWLNAAAGA